MSSLEKNDSIFKALADARRRQMLDLVRDQPLTTGEICKNFEGLDRCTVMQHLRVLEQADLIIVKREGRVRWNYLNAVPIQRIYDRWLSQYAAPSAALLRRLSDDLET